MYCPKCGSNDINKTTQKAESGRNRWRCGTCKTRTTKPAQTPPVKYFSRRVTDLRKYKRFVVTSAQNDTPIRTDFLAALQVYCKEENAALIVIPVRYKNPDSFHEAVQNGYSWPEEITPYLCDQNLKLNDNLLVMGDMKVQATAVNPLEGLDTISGHRSALIGHAQVAMKMIATPKKKFPKKLHTTGSISECNYSRTKQGAKARHHHSNGAVVVELEGGLFWTRQLSCDADGGFYDMDKHYSAEGVSDGHEVEAIVYGDLHEKFLSEQVKKATFSAPKSLTNILKPKRKVLHDILDQYSQSPHHAQNHILQLQKHWNGDDCLRDELDSLCTFLESIGGGDVIESNHHDHFTRWINSYKKSDLLNADLYFEVMEMMRTATERKSPFQLYLEKYCSAPLNFVDVDDEFMIVDIDCSQHGDRGSNGSRPSPKAFANAGAKMITGHRHSPYIEKGNYGTGTSTVDLEYARGLSSWMITHAAIYKNGKRTLVDIINGKFRPSWATKEKR